MGERRVRTRERGTGERDKRDKRERARETAPRLWSFELLECT